MPNEEDFEIEDLLENMNKKKERKKNTNKKRGNAGERELAKVLCERFPGRQFFRSIGSGNRWSQVELTEETRGAFTGDIVCPSDFRFCLENKYGYDIELFSLFPDGHKEIDEWLKTALRDAESLKKVPMVCWRKPHYKHLAFVPHTSFFVRSPGGTTLNAWHSFEKLMCMTYRDWAVVALSDLLKVPDEWWWVKK